MDVLVAVVFIWGIFGAIAAAIMSSKGQSGCGGFALGFFLGPLGLVVALVMPTDHRTLDSRALESGESRKCPRCAEVIKLEATKCRYCGSDLDPLSR